MIINWKDNFPRWLTETLETLMKERAADEQKAESQKLKQVVERVYYGNFIIILGDGKFEYNFW